MPTSSSPPTPSPSGLQVIGSGFGRTGTTTLKKALEILLTGECYHMSTLLNRDRSQQRNLIRSLGDDDKDCGNLDHYRHSEAWVHIAKNKANGRFPFADVDTEAMFADCTSTCDLPSSLYYNDLLRLYPNAKLVLTVRPFNEWYDSAKRTIYAPQTDFWTRAVRFLTIGRERVHFKLMELTWAGTPFDGNFLNETYTRNAIESWNDDVKQKYPLNKVLVYDVNEGWEPLCVFLNLPIPEVEFPRENFSVEFNDKYDKRTRSTLTTLLVDWGRVSVACGVGLCAAVCFDGVMRIFGPDLYNGGMRRMITEGLRGRGGSSRK